jgi:hypothetical protein
VRVELVEEDGRDAVTLQSQSAQSATTDGRQS